MQMDVAAVIERSGRDVRLVYLRELRADRTQWPLIPRADRRRLPAARGPIEDACPVSESAVGACVGISHSSRRVSRVASSKTTMVF
ncbi:hypothetical protein EVAR_12048_1 [Eumeta japonica]|uniref:Uncharacterized protein n=1 Tax=Eumeta variegata TaxID=151549 RepID=A0A4C1U5Q3_EUMVA|nr:hypothetical protein EVAR_12048_1 [Eumeta japonica]